MHPCRLHYLTIIALFGIKGLKAPLKYRNNVESKTQVWNGKINCFYASTSTSALRAFEHPNGMRPQHFGVDNYKLADLKGHPEDFYSTKNKRISTQ